MAELLRLARRRGWRVLEDCCQADGGSYRGRRLGSLGDMGAFSFNQYKILSCGEGGAAATSDRRLAERLFMAHDGSCCVWPETGPMHEAFFCGGNFRTNELSAAILRVQVRRLDGILADLRRTRRRFKAGLRLPAGFRLVDTADERGDCGVCFLVQAPDTAAAVRAEPLFAAHLSVHRPVNSGRHVYSAWRVMRERVGGHHPAWDCFRHPANRAIRTNYDDPLPRADDYLARTLLCRTPYRWPAARTARALRALNRALARAG
jgi:dTDP-4-amino-4,6-dideoxygalactose transaminase